MATALLDVEGREPAGIVLGIVSVHHLGIGHSTAACSCGWAGRRPRLMAAAEQDAWLHSMRDRCAVPSPLVLDW